MIFKYYCVDWAIFILLLTHLWLLGSRHRTAFIFGMLASALGIIFSLQTESVANATSSILFLFLHIRAYIKWKEPT